MDSNHNHDEMMAHNHNENSDTTMNHGDMMKVCY